MKEDILTFILDISINDSFYFPKQTFILERRTGYSRNDVGLRPGGIVMQGDLEIGSFACDMSLKPANEAGGSWTSFNLMKTSFTARCSRIVEMTKWTQDQTASVGDSLMAFPTSSSKTLSR
ncbi:hypothetical protein Vadar_009488 [Vaccinium darrowii]|uniref:Uncharacterized protein n=1 Tax=Vaccinium darrowii TaxID=229202 RepID=A0ACB7X8P2_9ERIC|nr:hypothetical protein Vadar_009488 [Vaccinium darrowii]